MSISWWPWCSVWWNAHGSKVHWASVMKWSVWDGSYLAGYLYEHSLLSDWANYICTRCPINVWANQICPTSQLCRACPQPSLSLDDCQKPETWTEKLASAGCHYYKETVSTFVNNVHFTWTTDNAHYTLQNQRSCIKMVKSLNHIGLIGWPVE